MMMSRAALSRLNPWMRILMIGAVSVPAVPALATVLLVLFGSGGLSLLFPLYAALLLLACDHGGLIVFSPKALADPRAQHHRSSWIAVPVALISSGFGIIHGAMALHLGAPLDLSVLLATILAQALMIVSMRDNRPLGPPWIAACWVLGLVSALSLVGIPLEGP